MEKKMNGLPLNKLAGKNPKKQIALAGYTQEQFAEMVGVDERTVRRWIKKFPGLDKLQKCVEALNVPVTDFFDMSS